MGNKFCNRSRQCFFASYSAVPSEEAYPQSPSGSAARGASVVGFLKNVPIFASLDDDQLKQISLKMSSLRHKAGDIVIRQGDPAYSFYVCVRGTAEVSIEGVGVVATYHAGDYFGERALLRGAARAATITATSDLMLLVLAYEDFEKLNLRKKVNFPARQAVVAEKLDVFTDEPLPTVPKPPEDKAAIMKAVENAQDLRGVIDFTQEQLEHLGDVASPLALAAGSIILKEGDSDAKEMYTIIEGSVDITYPNPGGKGSSVITLKAPCTVGALALLYGTPRKATVSANTDCKSYLVTRAHFKRILMRASQKRLQEYISFMDNVEKLSTLSKSEKRAVSQAMVECHFKKNDVIISQGEDGSSLYILFTGICQAEVDGRMVKTYSPGGFFGELALLRNERRKATVRATSDSTLLRIDRDAFVLVRQVLESGKTFGSATFKPPYFGQVGRADLKHLGYLGIGAFGSVSLERDNKGTLYALKALSKGHLQRTGMGASVVVERDILLACDSPCIIRLYNTYNDEQNLYLLLEACLCGDLFTLMQNHNLYGKLNCVAYYSAVVVEAFVHLHERLIVYRDLKTENVLLNSDGRCKVCDMGIAKLVVGQTYTLCGTPEYMAPEVIKQTGHNVAVDWWCLGIFIYELFTGDTPFSSADGDPSETFQAINNGLEKVKWKSKATPYRDLIEGLCRKSPDQRTPMQPDGVEKLKAHKLWAGFAWNKIDSSDFVAPFKLQAEDPATCCEGRVSKQELAELFCKVSGKGDPSWESEF